MAGRKIQFRRGTTAEHTTFTGAQGELTYDTEKKTLVLHDGTTIGGIELARMDAVPTDLSHLTDDGAVLPVQPANSTINGSTLTASTSGVGANPRWFNYNSDGTKVFTSIAGKKINEISLSTPYDLSTATWDYSTASSDLTNISAASIDGATFSADGTTVVVCHQISSPDTNDLTQYNLTTAFDISTITAHTATMDTRTDAGVTIGGAGSVLFGDDGNKLFALLNYPDLVMEYALSTPYDISSATFTASFNFKTATGADNILEMHFNGSGTKLLMTDNQNDSLYEIELSTAWDISTATYNNNFIDFSGIDGIPAGLIYNNDESKLYVAGGVNSRIYTFSLVTA